MAKTTTYACLEGMMYEATKAVADAVKAWKSAQLKYLTTDNDISTIRALDAKKALDAAMTRLSELETTKRILKEMEQKGAEL